MAKQDLKFRKISDVESGGNTTANPSSNGSSSKSGNSIGNFWYIVKNKEGEDVYKIDRRKLRLWMESIGIRKLYTTTTEFIIVRMQDNIVDFIDMATIKLLCLHYVEKQDEWKLTQTFEKGIGQYIRLIDMDVIKVMEKPFFRGEKNSIYIFYKDFIAVERKGEVSKMHYKDFKYIIWKSSILNRNYPDEVFLTDSDPGEFEQFFNNVIQQAENKMYVRQVLGYALNRYRNIAKMRAIIFNDENSDDEAKGGTGKGIFYQALSQFMTGVKENGKAFRANRDFSFQNISIDTRMVLIDDVPPTFDMTNLFSVITDGFYVEKKKKQPLWVPAEDAPIFIVNTNYGIAGTDDSSIRRRYDLGLDKYYNAKKTPEMEFGHQLFREWEPDSAEWIKFDLFMLECANMYVNDGVKIWTNPKLKEKQLHADTHPDFPDLLHKHLADFFLEKFADPNIATIDKNPVLDEVRSRMKKTATKTKVTTWVKKYAKYYNLEFETLRKSDAWKLSGDFSFL